MSSLVETCDAPKGSTRPDGAFFRVRGADLVANIGLLVAMWFAYSAVRGVTSDHVATAMGNAADLLRFQRVVGLPSELALQQTLIGRTSLLKAANVYYVVAHFPITVGFLGWTWLRHRDRFARIRNTMVAVTAAGLAVHVLFPLAPPRMLTGFVDTAKVFGPNPYDLKIASAANQIAAMPSLHVGWALLVSIGIIWILQSKWRFLAILHPVITAGVVVVTANHFWTDVIVAVSLVLVGWVAFRNHGRASQQELTAR